MLAGGGGWYGGAYGSRAGSGGGGSGYTVTDSAYKPTGYNVSEQYYMKDAQTIAGNQTVPSISSLNTEVGHSGDGYAKITLIS